MMLIRNTVSCELYKQRTRHDDVRYRLEAPRVL